MRNYTKILRIYGITTSKDSDERGRTLNHHLAGIRPLACSAALYFIVVECEGGTIDMA